MFSRRHVLIGTLGNLLFLFGGLSWAAQPVAPLPEEPFETRLAAAMKQLATYDFGEKQASLKKLSDLVAATRDKPEERRQLVAALAGALGSSMPRGAKQHACRQLANYGTAEAVPGLAGLLPDEDLSHMARYALERIPGEAADEALRRALGPTKGKLRVGLINSLGNRRSPSAVDDLSKLLADADVAVACAAAAALGRIGPAGAAALEKAPAGAPPAVQRALAEASLGCAETFLAEGNRPEAAAIYDRLRQGNAPKPCRIAATRGAILARQAVGAAVLGEQIKAEDPDLFGLALSLIRYEGIPEFTAVAIAGLDKVPPEMQVLLIEALADRGDKAAVAAVLRLAKEGDTKVRPTAVQALSKLGDAALARVLLAWAAGGDERVASAAASALAALPDKGADAALLAALEGADGKQRNVAIELLGQRRCAAATPRLLKAAADADQSVRRAALKALADTAGPQDVRAILALLLATKDAAGLAAVQSTLGAVCARMRDREAFVQQLAAELPRTSAEVRVALLNSLGQVGGAKALEVLASNVGDADPSVANAALHVLSEWRDIAAAPELLNIAKKSENRLHKTLALRGYVGLVPRDFRLDRKTAMCREAWALAGSTEEKRLVLGALGQTPSPEALDIVAPCLDDAALKEEAAAAATAICERLGANQKERIASAMKKVLASVQAQHLRDRAQQLLDRPETKKK